MIPNETQTFIFRVYASPIIVINNTRIRTGANTRRQPQYRRYTGSLATNVMPLQYQLGDALVGAHVNPLMIARAARGKL